MGLQSRQRDHAPLRRRPHPARLDGRGLAVWPRGARAVLRQGRARDRRVGSGRQRQRRRRSARQHFRRRARARISDAAAARHGVHGAHGRRGTAPRLASVSGAGGRELAALSRAQRLPLSRLLQPRRLPRRSQELDGRIDDSARGANGQLERGHRSARHAHRRRRRRPGRGRAVSERRRDLHPAGFRRAARGLHVRERAAVVVVHVGRVSARPCE